MKKVIAWAKANLAVVIASALIVLLLPAAAVGAMMWNSSIRAKREAEVNKVMTELGGAAVKYTLPPATPGGQPVTWDSPAPNPKATAYFKEQKAKIEGQIGALVKTVEGINSAGHAPLLDGVFPRPTSQTRTLEFVDVLVGRGDKPSAYQLLLREARAGGPASATQIAAELRQIEEDAIAKARAENPQATGLTAEQTAALGSQGTARRLAEYRRHAETLGVFATVDNLPPDILRAAPGDVPDAARAFQWQWDYWILADLLRAVAAANTSEGKPLDVTRGVVKRVEQIVIEPLRLTAPGADPSAAPTPPPGAGGPSITGRGLTPSQTFDVRHADMTLIVASARLPELINAISRTNFMTVVGVQIAEADPWADLESGYFYGTDHVCRVTLRIESVWLRSWMGPLMPEAFKAALTGQATTEAAPVAAPPPAPPPRPAAGGAKGGATKAKTNRGGGKQRGGGGE